ncbi:hypothetical protein EW146_g3026 [Bondarzewia mesenterica]|uniref:Tr-type G domain-containing protein n=1 Tax=Bondarzewia mesenterica TaxID=1095465 RepID=A0A4S4M0C8_9AGAM|nr:hypothetical protein EW146_g3026 [Bondarzewia mesenterica]
MTSLRTFQDEIDKVRHREVARKKAAQTATEKEDKEHRRPSNKGKDADNDPSHPSAQPLRDNVHTSDLEENIKNLLLSNDPRDQDSTRDLVASLLTSCRGEFLSRIGSHPPLSKLFSNEALEDRWTGDELDVAQLETAVTNLTRAVEEVGGKACLLLKSTDEHPRATILLRLPPPSVSLTPEVRCAVVGNVDSGKSTMLGVLTRGGLDDGRGLARVALFRHKHEIETGRTSSVGMEILGFDAAGAPILPNTAGSNDPDVIRREKLGWELISAQSAKMITFIDLAGHERYLKTTLYGLTSGAPSCVILMVGANAGLIGMSKEHLAIALALNVPVVVCITKIDMTPPNKLEETVKQVAKILKSPGCRKNPVFVDTTETAIEISQVFAAGRICPVFRVSNVTGAGLDLVRTFLNLLPPSESEERFDVTQPLEYSVTEVWSVPYVGTVVNGILNSGTVKKGDAVLLGPDSNGSFIPTVIKDMQRKRATVTTAEAGQTVSFALKRMKKADVKKGMVIVHRTETPPRAVRRFEGQVLILYHNTTMQRNYQAMLHCGAVRQTVKIVSINHPQGLLRTGDRATVEFEFISRPEFIKEGMKLLFREGKTKVSVH